MSNPVPPPRESTEPSAEAGSRNEVPALRQIGDFVGARIRHRRCERGWTQERLAHELGISYQQVQKYETGANRINAGRLYQIAVSLEVDVGYFYERIAHTHTVAALEHGGKNRVAIELVRNFADISDQPLRYALAGLIRTLAEAGATLRRRD